MSRASKILETVSGPDTSPLPSRKTHPWEVTVMNHDGSGVEVTRHRSHGEAVDQARSKVGEGRWGRGPMVPGRGKSNQLSGSRSTAVITGYTDDQGNLA